jgi:quercetin dioxygenase-like cupin family protein
MTQLDCAECLRFVTSKEAVVESMPWGRHDWLARAGLTDSKLMQLVRVTMPAGKAHAFHRHPHMEELLYVIAGRVEQWVGRQSRILGPGELAHVPMNEVHGSYNVFSEPVTFLAVLGPALIDGPALVDVQHDEPWRDLKAPLA